MHQQALEMLFKKEDEGQFIVLVGNPNVGKSVIFHALTNIYVDVSNFPGTTLDIHHGRWNRHTVIDSPGVYGISSFNDEERAARDVILLADTIINVVNAANLERDLFLTQHIIDCGIPCIVVLNMLDEARRSGIRIDAALLSSRLGVPVLEAVATKRQGLEALKAHVGHAALGRVTPQLRGLLAEKLPASGRLTQRERLLIQEGDADLAAKYGVAPGRHLEAAYSARRDYVDALVAEAQTCHTEGARWSVKLGHWLLRPIIGFPFLAAMLFSMYKIIGQFIAGDVVGWTEKRWMIGHYEPMIVRFFTDTLHIPRDSLPGTLLVGEFGVLTMTPVYVLGLLLPLVFSFYLFLSIFEDSGYLPRLAALVDRFLRGIGLNGKAIIPLILGFGCVTMATVTTRILGSEREKRIATYLLGLVIPCSAQLAVITALLSGVGAAYSVLYGLIILMVLVIVGVLLDETLGGRSSALLIDIPPMRFPRPLNVLKKTWSKTFHFLEEATPLFATGSLLIGVLTVTGLLYRISDLLRPLTVSWLGLPAGASRAFIMGIVRRDFGATGLYDLRMSNVQTITALTTITLFVPCIASVLVLFKERAPIEALLMWLSTFGVAFLIGGLVSQSLHRVSAYSTPVQYVAVLGTLAAVGYTMKLFAFVLIGGRRRDIHADSR